MRFFGIEVRDGELDDGRYTSEYWAVFEEREFIVCRVDRQGYVFAPDGVMQVYLFSLVFSMVMPDEVFYVPEHLAGMAGWINVGPGAHVQEFCYHD